MAIGDMVLTGIALQLFGPRIRENSVVDDFATVYLINNLISKIGDAKIRAELSRAVGPVLERSAQLLPKSIEVQVKEGAAAA
jgi:hypothetical protein